LSPITLKNSSIDTCFTKQTSSRFTKATFSRTESVLIPFLVRIEVIKVPLFSWLKVFKIRAECFF
jgi:hypothetical protein